MPKLFDVMAAGGRYTDQNGQEKTRWIRCGAVIKNENGNTSLILENIPLGLPPNEGGAGIWFSLFKPEPKQQQAPQQGTGYAQPQQQSAPPPAPPPPVDEGW